MDEKAINPDLHSLETIVSVLAHHVKERPNHQLFRWVDEKAKVTDSLSYKELWDKSCAVAQLLEDNEVKNGDRVMIAYPFGLDFLAGLLGCMMAGVIGCSVYPPNPKQLSTDLPPFNLKAKDAGAKFALTTMAFRRFMSLNSFIGKKSVVTWLATDRLRTPDNNWSPRISVNDVSPNDVAFIQYTSGSTGSPKGVMISQRSLVYNTRLCAETCDASKVSDPIERARFSLVSWMPQYHDMGLIGFFFVTIYTGASGVTCSPLDFILNPVLWHDMVIKFKANSTMGPNFSFGLLLKRLRGRKRPFDKWSFMNKVICAAEPVDPEVMGQALLHLGIQPSSLYVGYGLAEVGLAVCFCPFSVRDGLVACGNLDGDASICIVNEANQKVEDGAVGEVFVQAPSQVALGYWLNPEATQRTFSCTVVNMKGTWLATGDLGKVIDNKVYITGRKEEVIILNGRNFFPVDIERVVEKAYPLVIRPGCVVAYQHSDEGVGLVADLRKGVRADNRPSPLDISTLISKECMVPTEYVCLLKTNSIPKTTSGKSMRVQVKEMSIAGTWSKSMVEIEWRKSQKASESFPRKGNGPSALENPCSLVDETAKVGGTESIGVYGRQGMSAFYKQHGGCPYKHGDIVEEATLDYANVVSELQAMEGRLDAGEIVRKYDAAEYILADNRFWREVPGVPPKQFALAQDAAIHRSYLPWLKGLFAGMPRLAFLRNDIRGFISENGRFMGNESMKEWVFITQFRHLASKTLSSDELSDFKKMHSRVIDLVQRQAKLPGDEELMTQKASHVQDFMERLSIDDDKASCLLDLLIFTSENLAVTLNICSAVMFSQNEYFDLSSHHIDEDNIMQFVWECLRMFPTQAAVAWREQGGVRHASVIGMTGRDPSLWGDDVESFRLDRCSASEFSRKSCLFAEQAGNYACKGKTFVLEAVSAFLLELLDSGPWKCSVENMRCSPTMPYFDPLKLRRLPRAIVVGGGIAGLACALQLSQRGIKVTLVERNNVLGGHARHAEVLGGHQRNPAFGALVISMYPNLMNLIDALGLEKIDLGKVDDFRQNVAFDGHQVPSPDPQEVGRFLAQMQTVYQNNSFGHSQQSIGDFLVKNGYDHKFVCYFIVGRLVHYFAGLTVEQYLEIPLDLFAWFVVTDMNMGPLDRVFRLRNKEYMDAFTSRLSMNGVDIVTGITPRLLSRSNAGVSVAVGDTVVSADKMVLAMPPNAAATFLGEHIDSSEVVLHSFDCPLETVVLHQDPKWSPKDKQGLFGLFPNSGNPLPSKTDTIPMTTAFVSDTDFKTPIFVTHAYANDMYANLDIEGPKEYAQFTHVRITSETVNLRNTLRASQGTMNTYFAGGWLQGFMLHEDALVTGMEVANEILKGCDLEPYTILSRKIGLRYTQYPTKGEVHSEPSRGISSRSNQKVLRLIAHELGRDIRPSDRLQDLGLSSLNISSLHASLHEKFGLTDDELPVSVFFDGDMLVGDLVSLVPPSASSLRSLTVDSTNGREDSLNTVNEILSIISDEVGSPLGPETKLEELGMTSLSISSLHAALHEKYGLSGDDLPISMFLEGTTSIKDVIERVQSRHRGRISEKSSNVLTSSVKTKSMRPHEQPLFDKCVAIVVQILAIVSQAVFLGCTIYVPILCSLILTEELGGWRALLLSPLLFHVHAITSAILLIIVKWTLVGRQKKGHTALWSLRFAGRWIVRKCSRLLWTYTLWGLCGRMEILNILHRLLGCTIGDGASIEPGCIMDYDLVAIGSGTSIEAEVVINTSSVSLGVQSLDPVVLGSNCTIRFGSLVERGATVRDGVHLEPRTLVAPFSILEERSAWHGKPAERVEAVDDIEMGRSKSSEQPLPSHSEHSTRGIKWTHLMATRIVTVLLLTPCLFLAEFSGAVFIGSTIYGQLGYLGLGGLLWVPPTVVCLLLFAISITMKRLLLGTVKPGVWPRGGAFHAKKYFVDHLIEAHAVRWKFFSTNCGSCLAGSRLFELQLLSWLGAKVDSFAVHTHLWTQYDLLSVGSRVLVGGEASFHPWHTTRESLIGKSITLADDCFVAAGASVLGGVTVSEGTTVAAYSVANRNVEVGQTTIGARQYQTAADELDREQKSVFSTFETGHLVAMCAVWIGISSFVWLFVLVAEGANVTVNVNGVGVFDKALTMTCTAAVVFLLVLPSYLLVMMWVGGKAIRLGRRSTPALIPRGNKEVIPYYAVAQHSLECWPYTVQAFGGTFVETFQWAALGANLGRGVYLDGIFMFEPDMVTVGDYSTVTGRAILTPHHHSRRTYTYGPISIGKRCTVSAKSNVQLAALDDDTQMMGLSMALTGSKLKSGTYTGYPARRVGNASQPPRPPRSAWITLLFNPCSTMLGCLWLLTLPFRPCFSFLRNALQVAETSDVESSSSPAIPNMLKGIFSCEDRSLKLKFDASEWISEVRVLRMPAGSFMVAREGQKNDRNMMSWWWRVASYEFDLSNNREYVGRVSLGWWDVPLSVVTAKLCIIDGTELSWSHSWFTGDPEDEMRFMKSSDLKEDSSNTMNDGESGGSSV